MEPVAPETTDAMLPQEAIDPPPDVGEVGALSSPLSGHPLLRALNAYLCNRPQEAVDILSQYHPKDQELLLRLLPVVARVDQGGLLTDGLDDEERLQLLGVVESLHQDLQSAAPLRISRLVFCRRARSFGQVDPRPTNIFRPGDPVCVYVELENLVDRRVEKNRYVIRLSGQLEIRDSRGKKVKHIPIQQAADWSWSPRSDHFTLIRFRVPPRLPPGIYTLHVRIRDQDTGRDATEAIAFRIIRHGSRAGSDRSAAPVGLDAATPTRYKGG